MNNLKPLHFILIGIVTGISLIVVLSYTTPDFASAISTSTDTLITLGNETSLAKNYAVKLPKEVSFAGEQVPLHDFQN